MKFYAHSVGNGVQSKKYCVAQIDETRAMANDFYGFSDSLGPIPNRQSQTQKSSMRRFPHKVDSKHIGSTQNQKVLFWASI